MAERESEPFVMVTSDLRVQGCRNYVSSPLGKLVYVSLCAHGGESDVFPGARLPLNPSI